MRSLPVIPAIAVADAELQPATEAGALRLTEALLPRHVARLISRRDDRALVASPVGVVERIEEIDDDARPLPARDRDRLLDAEIHVLRVEHVAEAEERLGRRLEDVRRLLVRSPPAAR